MCWSPEADMAAGLVIGAISIDALHHIREPQQLPLASLPVVLAAHQLTEVFVWWGLDGTVSQSVGRAATYTYLFVAFALPLLVPLAVAAIEPDDRRRQLMDGLGIVGAVVAVVLLAGVLSGPVTAVDEGNHLAYQAHLWQGVALTAVYVAVTLGCALLSSHRFIRLFGSLNLAAVGALAWLTATGFVSLWCSWAAVTSLVIAVHMRRAAEPDQGAVRLLDGRKRGAGLRFPW